MDIKKKAFLEAYIRQLGNVTNSCKEAGIHRRTYYVWLDNDPEFKEAIENTEPDELILDIAEHELFKAVRNGDMKATFFLLNNKGKARGYGHPKEVKVSATIEPITGIEVK